MLSRNRTFAFPCALAFALALIVAPPPAFAEQEPVQPGTTESGQDSAPRDGWDATKEHWYEDGEMARDHAFFDPDSDAWYWADADGSIACDKDVFIPVDESDRDKGGKWVRFDENRAMVKGEDYRYDAWYYFDPITGEMAKGITLIEDSAGPKWVYYDWTTGKMAHGEAFVNYDAEHTGWYLFDQHTGAMVHGFAYLDGDPSGKWVYYDQTTGIMAYGLQLIDDAWYYLDPVTGAVSYGMTYVPTWGTWRYFDKVSGRWYEGMPMGDWQGASGGAYPSLSGRADLNVHVDIANQVVLVRDGTEVLYAMVCSSGINDCTPRGTYSVTGRGYSFYNRREAMGGRYYVQFYGDYLFHSVPTDAAGNYMPAEGEKLGQPASHGCVRLTVSDAKWLYDNLPNGTRVTIE